MKLTERQANFELLRIVSMILIVVGHSIYHGLRHITSPDIPDIGWNTSNAVDAVNFFCSQWLGYVCNIGVNLFVMITGYFTVTQQRKDVNLKKIGNLWLKILFYSVAIYAVMVSLHQSEFSFPAAIATLTPIYHNTYWFMTVYFGLMLLSPFIACMLQNISHRQYATLLIILTIMNFQQDEVGYGAIYSDGMGIFFFIYLYCIGGFIRRYDLLAKYQKYGLLAHVLLSFMLAVAVSYKQYKLIGTPSHEFLYVKGLANNSFPILSSVAVFLWFKNLKIKRGELSNVILLLSPCVLGVYLLHDNHLVRPLLWDRIEGYIHNPLFIIYLLLYCVAVFLICIIFEYIRKTVISYCYEHTSKH